MDLMLLIDTTCIYDSECGVYTEGIAELFAAVKGEFSLPRISVATFDGSNVAVEVEFNDENYNKFDRNHFRIGVEQRKQFYNDIRTIECDGNGNTGDSDAAWVKTVDSKSAIEAALEAFVYQETVFLPNMGAEYVGRDKKIVLFSTCADVANECFYETGPSREVEGDQVEVTVFNVMTSSSTLEEDYYECLVGGDAQRMYNVGTTGNTLQLSDITDVLEQFRDEVCNIPTQDPTDDPTVDPTSDPTKDPTKDPTSDPTHDPTQNPTPPRCTCDNLAYTLDFIESCEPECPGGCPVGSDEACDRSPNCYLYEIKRDLSVIIEDRVECKYPDMNEQNVLEPHEPTFIMIPPPDDCEITMQKFEYWAVVQNVTGGQTRDTLYYTPWEELVDPDPLTGLPGIKIPIVGGFNSNHSYFFKICLYGITERIKTGNLQTGWSYTNSETGASFEYGYNCESTVGIPNLCEDMRLFAHAPGNLHVDNRIDLLSHGLKPKEEPRSPNSFFELYTAYSLWVLAAVVTIFALNVIVCVYIKCIARSTGSGSGSGKKRKAYGFISEQEVPKFDDDSDTTDSEWDSHSED
eukprot:281071_1